MEHVRVLYGWFFAIIISVLIIARESQSLVARAPRTPDVKYYTTAAQCRCTATHRTYILPTRRGRPARTGSPTRNNFQTDIRSRVHGFFYVYAKILAFHVFPFCRCPRSLLCAAKPNISCVNPVRFELLI